MNTIGIDFGTSFCTASWINPTTSKPEAITFYGNGNQKIPSVVYYAPEGKIVGQAAYDQLEYTISMNENERNQIISSVVQSIKRKMQKGQKFFVPGGGCVTHEEIISDLLHFIKKDVEAACFNGKSVEKVVITHPVCFENWKKEMLIKAANLAGFKVVDLLEEPIAAALGYAASAVDIGKGILVYDFGGGTFDVAYVMRDEDGSYRVPVEPEGDPFCGGDDIDLVFYDIWEREAKQKFNRPISNLTGRIDLAFILRCRRQKESLSTLESYKFAEVLPPPGFHRMQMQIYRKDINKLIDPIIDKTIVKTERLLKRINDKGLKIDTAVLIGGSSRIPLVYEKLKKILPVELRKPMQVDVAVALGAVMYDLVNIIKPDPIPEPNPKDMFCIYTGGKISTADKYCIYCGRENKVGIHR